MRQSFIVGFALSAAVALVPVARAQMPAERTEFEVASVRENRGGATGALIGLNPDAFRLENLPLRSIIGLALGFGSQRDIRSFERYRLSDGPFRTLLDRRFDIVAKTPDGTTGTEVRAMLLALLEDRFQFRSHLETRQMPLYVLSVRRPGQLGPGATPSTIDCDETVTSSSTMPDASTFRAACVQTHRTPTTVGYRSTGSVLHLIGRVQSWVDRPIVDRTGLKGFFEWTVSFRTDPFDAATDAPTIFQAFEEQLGLRLESEDGPLEVVVVDNVTLPSPN